MPGVRPIEKKKAAVLSEQAPTGCGFLFFCMAYFTYILQNFVCKFYTFMIFLLCMGDNCIYSRTAAGVGIEELLRQKTEGEKYECI